MNWKSKDKWLEWLVTAAIGAVVGRLLFGSPNWIAAAFSWVFRLATFGSRRFQDIPFRIAGVGAEAYIVVLLLVVLVIAPFAHLTVNLVNRILWRWTKKEVFSNARWKQSLILSAFITWGVFAMGGIIIEQATAIEEVFDANCVVLAPYADARTILMWRSQFTNEQSLPEYEGIERQMKAVAVRARVHFFIAPR